MKYLMILALVFGLNSSAQSACIENFIVENNTTAPSTVGQSFTVPCSGLMTSVTVKANTPVSGLMTLKIYNGQSHAAGDLLYTKTGLPALVHGENTYTLSPNFPPVTSGQQYTFLFTDESALGIRFRYDITNSYAGWQATAGAGFVAGSDIWFRINIGDNIPTLSEWGIILFSLFILAAALPKLRRKAL